MARMVLRLVVLFALALLWVTAAPAGERLALDDALAERVASACPDCVARGVIACGDAAVETGPRYRRHAFLGSPARAFLLSWPMAAAEMRHLAATLPRAAAEATIAERFRAATLAAIEADGRVRALGPPVEVTVRFPAALYACLAQPAKPWGCCVGDCSTGECCEKSLGSIAVRVRWTDQETNESLSFRWSRNGGSMLLRHPRQGPRTDYFCLAWAPLSLR